MAKIVWNFGAINDALQNLNNHWGPEARQRRAANQAQLDYYKTRNQMASKEAANYDEDRATTNRRQLFSDAAKAVQAGGDPDTVLQSLDPNYDPYLVDEQSWSMHDVLRGMQDQANQLLDIKQYQATKGGRSVSGDADARLLLAIRSNVAKQLAALGSRKPSNAAQYDAIQAKLDKIDGRIGEYAGLEDTGDTATTPPGQPPTAAPTAAPSADPAAASEAPSTSVPAATLDWLVKLLAGNSIPVTTPGGTSQTPGLSSHNSLYSGL